MNQDSFKEYLIQTKPNKRDKSYAWYTAIGLQAVDGLKPFTIKSYQWMKLFIIWLNLYLGYGKFTGKRW